MPEKYGKRTYDEIYRAVLFALPNASLGEDNAGQIIVYTNMYPDVMDSTGNSYVEYENLSEVQQSAVDDGERTIQW